MLGTDKENSVRGDLGRRLITETDRLRLSALLEGAAQHDRLAANLQARLCGYVPVQQSEVPRDLVTMNSMVRGVIEGEGTRDSTAVRIVTLTYPHAANMAEGSVSVLTPLGLELLGSRVGDVVDWLEDDDHPKTMLIDEVLFQPETSKDLHL
jgi:regulator of nucleoside diphosphate kinase